MYDFHPELGLNPASAYFYEILGKPFCSFEPISSLTIKGLPYRVAGRFDKEQGRGKSSREAC